MYIVYKAPSSDDLLNSIQDFIHARQLILHSGSPPSAYPVWLHPLLITWAKDTKICSSSDNLSSTKSAVLLTEIRGQGENPVRKERIHRISGHAHLLCICCVHSTILEADGSDFSIRVKSLPSNNHIGKASTSEPCNQPFKTEWDLVSTKWLKGPLWWLRRERICLQCRRPGSDPWVGKIPQRRAWQPSPVFLPGESLWTEEPGRLQSMGSQRVGHDWVSTAQHKWCQREIWARFRAEEMGESSIEPGRSSDCGIREP